MADGIRHAAGTLVLTPVAAAATWWLTDGDLTTVTIAGTGCLSGLLISPDLDMETVTVSEYWLVRWTLGLGWLWVMLWYPYALIARHRGLSHTPVIGTVGRALYLIILYVGLYLLLGFFFNVVLPLWPLLFWQPGLIFIGGLTISDIGHWYLDG
ncbi:MAG TPA: DUF2227 family putative metal-binding protein [Anaerolineae bacterium]|jgi:uncharacterized metal-binding protein